MLKHHGGPLQGGPQKPVINGVITSISRVISPQLPIYFRPFIGAPFHSICNDRLRRPTLYHHINCSKTTTFHPRPLFFCCEAFFSIKRFCVFRSQQVSRLSKLIRNTLWTWVFRVIINTYNLGCPPAQDHSHHQDYYIFSRGSLSTFIFHCYWEEKQPNLQQTSKFAIVFNIQTGSLLSMLIFKQLYTPLLICFWTK